MAIPKSVWLVTPSSSLIEEATNELLGATSVDLLVQGHLFFETFRGMLLEIFPMLLQSLNGRQ